jgi:hypothetical protein
MGNGSVHFITQACLSAGACPVEAVDNLTFFVS